MLYTAKVYKKAPFSMDYIFKAAFTRQTKVGKLVLANSSWCV